MKAKPKPPKNTVPKVEFGSLEPGDCFNEDNGNGLWMKLQYHPDIGQCAVDLATGATKEIKLVTLVIHHPDAECIWDRK